MSDVVEFLRAALPEVFRESHAAKLTGGVLQPGTMANQRSRREVDPGCYGYDADGRVVIYRDIYLDRFYGPRLAARQAFATPLRRPADGSLRE